VLTGAGVSAESGVATFRDAGGLWENHPVEQVATPEGFRQDPGLVWRFYSERRRQARTVHPNPGHTALAAVEERMGDRFLLVTQNVDGLHRRAGSPPFADDSLHLDGEVPECERCAAAGRRGLLRPAIVWFGEMLDFELMHGIQAFIEHQGPGRLVFLAVGTSGVVYPAAGLVREARAAGGETWLVNLEPPDNRSAFDEFVQGPSGQVLPDLVEWA
jgi:NAD-dependent deacetylase